MLNNIISILKKPSRMILFVGSIVVFALTALSGFGNIGGDFFPVFIGIIVLVAKLAATAAIPTLLILKKDDIAKIVFVILSGYWLISSAEGQLSYASTVGYGTALYDCAAVFSVLFGLCLLAVIVLIVLGFALKGKDFKAVDLLILCGAIILGLVALILWCVIYGKNQYPWTSFVSSINYFVVIPVTVSGGLLYYFVEVNKVVKVEEQPEEPVQEQAEEPSKNQENQ